MDNQRADGAGGQQIEWMRRNDMVPAERYRLGDERQSEPEGGAFSICKRLLTTVNRA